MFKTIKILILKSDSQDMSKFKEIYRNSVSVPKDVSFDYDLIGRALHLLYSDCLIQFTIA